MTKTFFTGVIPTEVESLIRRYSAISGKRDYTTILKMYLLQNFVLDVELFKNAHLNSKSLSTYMGMIRNATKGTRVGYEDTQIYNFVTEVARLIYPVDAKDSVTTPRKYLEKRGWLKFFTDSSLSSAVQLKLDVEFVDNNTDKLETVLTRKAVDVIHKLFKDKRFKGGYCDLWLKSYLLCQYPLTDKLVDIAFQGLKIKKASVSAKLSICRRIANNLPYQKYGYGRIIEFAKELKKIIKPFPLYAYAGNYSGNGSLEALIEKLSSEDKRYLFAKLDGTDTISKERVVHTRKTKKIKSKIDRISRKDLPFIEINNEGKETITDKQKKNTSDIEVSSQIISKEIKKKNPIFLIDKENHTFQETALGEEEIKEVFNKLNLWNKYDIAKPVVS